MCSTLEKSTHRFRKRTKFWSVFMTTGKKVVLIKLKQNKHLAFLNERFEAGHLVPVIDGPYKLSDARDAFRHFAAAKHKGKVVITMD